MTTTPDPPAENEDGSDLDTDPDDTGELDTYATEWPLDPAADPDEEPTHGPEDPDAITEPDDQAPELG
jgi:hypothetical protein